MNNRQQIFVIIMLCGITSSQYVEFHTDHRSEGQKKYINYSFRYFVDAADVSLDHWETKDSAKVSGGYGVKDPHGNVRTVYYEVEDDSGFKAIVKTRMPNSFHYQKLWNNQPKTPYQHAQPVSSVL